MFQSLCNWSLKSKNWQDGLRRVEVYVRQHVGHDVVHDVFETRDAVEKEGHSLWSYPIEEPRHNDCVQVPEIKYYYFVSPLLNYSFFFLYSINFVSIRRPHQDCKKKKRKKTHMYTYILYNGHKILKFHKFNNQRVLHITGSASNV